MNRAERRRRAREISKDEQARRCPVCGKKSLFVAIPTENYLCHVKCELCQRLVFEDVEGLIPFTYVQLPNHPTEKGGE